MFDGWVESFCGMFDGLCDRNRCFGVIGRYSISCDSDGSYCRFTFRKSGVKIRFSTTSCPHSCAEQCFIDMLVRNSCNGVVGVISNEVSHELWFNLERVRELEECEEFWRGLCYGYDLDETTAGFRVVFPDNATLLDFVLNRLVLGCLGDVFDEENCEDVAFSI